MKTRALAFAALILFFAATIQAQSPAAQQPAPQAAPPAAPATPPPAAQQPAPAPAPAATPAPEAPPKTPPSTPQTPPKPAPGQSHAAPPAAQTPPAPDPEAELEKAVQDADNDSAKVVRNLEDYLKRFPDAPRKADIYRAIVESSVQLHDSATALDYAERLIALDPNDAEMMMQAALMLEQKGDDASLKRAVDYASRVLDQIQKADPTQRSPRMSAEEWEAGRKRAEMSVYILRGHLQMDVKDFDAAQKDFSSSMQLYQNPEAALDMGEIAELLHRPDDAIKYYAEAFVMPDQEGANVDRSEIRQKLGNLWREQHGSEVGLGERLLQAYDETVAIAHNPEAQPVPNKGITDPLAFVLRRPDGAAPFQMSDLKGKTVVLTFWATWCTPCSELDPLLAQVLQEYAGRHDLAFLTLNTDEDESRVLPYLQRQHIPGTVLFADGLDDFYNVKSLPTLVILDSTGKVSYRAEGFDPDTIVTELKGAIQHALTASP
jgi:thiol-disulfide isomerase/thioredoxin